MTAYPIDVLRSIAAAAYRECGVPPTDSDLVADVQLDADMRGVDTHGLQRLPWYVDRLLAGENNPAPDLRVVKESAISVTLDGDNGLGQLVCTRLVEKLIEKARDSGVAFGSARGSNDWGCGAYYPLLAAQRGLVAFGTTTSLPALPPWGARAPLTGNNPIVYAIPRRQGPPLVLDMALTPVALGKVMRARAEGTEIPLDWGFRDRDGVPTSDPTTALRGLLPAIGGYKGVGLSQVMDLLAGAMANGPHSTAVANEGGSRAQLFWVLDPGLLGEREAFLDGVEELVEQVHAAEPLAPADSPPMVPGEPEWRRAEEARSRGTLSYPASVEEALAAVAVRFGLDWPPPSS